MAHIIAPLTVGPLTLIYRIFAPIRYVLQAMIRRVSPQQTEEVKRGAAILKESDFLMIMEEGHKEGAIQETELELVRKVFQLDDTAVADVSTPLSQVQTLSANMPLRSALGALRNQRYSRIPVTGAQNKREVLGILYSKDLLRAKLQPELMDLPISSVMKKPMFVSPNLRLNALFRKFKQQRTHMAVVQKPNGEVIGVVTMSDVLDTLFEDVLT
jgi:CBS domain containing-hemolysin-like protein